MRWTRGLGYLGTSVATVLALAAPAHAGGDFAGQRVNGVDNNKPYLAAYPGA